MKKFGWIVGIFLIVFLSVFVWWKYFFVFGEGVKAGSLNYFVKKGIIFKTYEGRIVQEGFQSPSAGALQSNEFRFSVADEEVAKRLERSSGRHVELRYKEYNGILPWRGASSFVVIEVLDVHEPGKASTSGVPFDQ